MGFLCGQKKIGERIKNYNEKCWKELKIYRA